MKILKSILFASIFSTVLWAQEGLEKPIEYKGFLGLGMTSEIINDETSVLILINGANRVNSWLMVGLEAQLQLNTLSLTSEGQKFTLKHSTFGANFWFPLLEKENYGIYLPFSTKFGILKSFFSTEQGGQFNDYYFAPSIGLDFNYRITQKIALSIGGAYQQALGVETPSLENSDFSIPYLKFELRYTP